MSINGTPVKTLNNKRYRFSLRFWNEVIRADKSRQVLQIKHTAYTYMNLELLVEKLNVISISLDVN